MSGRTIAIGDIHGCSLALDAIVAAIDPQPSDLIVTLGDYIDRGPDSRGVLDRLLALSRRCKLVSLIGNHEVMLIQGLGNQKLCDLWCECGGDTTLASYGGSLENIPREHLQFLTRCHRYYETDNHFFVHANYDADLPLDQQSDELLLWTHLVRKVPRRHISGKTAVVGHTPQANCRILELPHLICLDTCCYGRGCLTALDLNSHQLWQATATGELLPQPS